MTAIYAVWNNIGFSLASDSNQSVQQDNQTWIDPVEKILMLEKHQIAIGGAGAALHQGIEVNEMFRTWERTIPDSGFEIFDDYFLSFARWYASQKFAVQNDDYDVFREQVAYWFDEFCLFLQTDIPSPAEIDEILFPHLQSTRTLLNFYGEHWDVFAEEGELEDSVLSDVYNAFQRLHDVYQQNNQGNSDETSFNISAHPDFPSEISEILVDLFQEKFKITFDEENDSHQRIVELCLLQLENQIYVDCPVKFLMIGYGKSDWLAKGITFEFSQTFFGVPRLRLTHYSNPNQNWYLALAIETAVHQLTSGHSRERGAEILELAAPHLKNGHAENFETELNQLMNQRFHSSLARIESLTLGRLEFVSRLFVQIEALKSFLDEPVPGVGGDTQVISMTKTTRRQKYYRELD